MDQGVVGFMGEEGVYEVYCHHLGRRNTLVVKKILLLDRSLK